MAWYESINWGQVAQAGIGALTTIYAANRAERAAKLNAARDQSLLASMYAPPSQAGAARLDGKGATSGVAGVLGGAGGVGVWVVVALIGGVVMLLALR
jgi:hypothetical protein